MKIHALVAAAFNQAYLSSPGLRDQWVQRSLSLGSVLPHSLLSVSVQRCGDLDILLRGLESETSQAIAEQRTDLESAITISRQHALSEVWVGSAYEICRLLNEIERAPTKVEFGHLAHNLRLLRVPLEKMQIAADRRIKTPLQLQTRTMAGEPMAVTNYDSSDPLRSHIMPSGLSIRGSVCWQAIDLLVGQSVWLERQWLADLFLSSTEAGNPP